MRSAPEQNARPAPVSNTARIVRIGFDCGGGGAQVLDQLQIEGVQSVGPVERDKSNVFAPLE